VPGGKTRDQTVIGGRLRVPDRPRLVGFPVMALFYRKALQTSVFGAKADLINSANAWSAAAAPSQSD
jgi:hypothetical protein